MKGVFQKIFDERYGAILVPVGMPAEEALRVVRRSDNTILYSFDNAREALAALKDGKVVLADVKGARNPLQLNLFWALVNLLVQNSPNQFPNKYITKIALCRELGYVDMWVDPTGRMQIIDKSIAVESMEQAEFNEFFQAAVDKISGHLASAPETVRAELDAMLSGQHALMRTLDEGPDPNDPRFAETMEQPPGAPEKPAEAGSGPPPPDMAGEEISPQAPALATEGPPPPDAEIAEPTTAAAYADYFIDWLKRSDTEEYIDERWGGETDLRNRCRVEQERWTHMMALKAQRIRNIRGGRRR